MLSHRLELLTEVGNSILFLMTSRLCPLRFKYSSLIFCAQPMLCGQCVSEARGWSYFSFCCFLFVIFIFFVPSIDLVCWFGLQGCPVDFVIPHLFNTIQLPIEKKKVANINHAQFAFCQAHPVHQNLHFSPFYFSSSGSILGSSIKMCRYSILTTIEFITPSYSST